MTPSAAKTHQAIVYRSCLPGVEAMYLCSARAFPRHAHDHYGLGVMTAGAQKSWSGTGTVESAAGDVIMVNPAEMHDGTPIAGARAWHIVYLEPDLVRRELIDELDGVMEWQPVAHDARLATAVLQWLRALQGAMESEESAEESLLVCLAHVAQKHRLSGRPLPLACAPVTRAKQWIEAEPDAATSLSALAAACDMSRFQLIRGFVRETGTTPHAYRIQLRVRLARRFLAERRSVAEAALLSGFADQSHLTRAFVRQFGVTPARYQAAIG